MKKLILTILTAVSIPILLWTSPPEVKRPRIVGLTHIAVHVHDLNAARHFYSDLLGFEEAFTAGETVFLKVNDRQYVALVPESKPEDPRFVDYAIETDDAEGLRAFLKSQGVNVPEKVGKSSTYNLSFRMTDTDDNPFEVMQYTPESLSVQGVGKHLSDERVSRRLLHVGLPVSKPETAKLYIETLGFREFWRANAPTGDSKLATLANLKVPNGDDYIEWHLSRRPLPAFAQRKGPYHIALEVPDMAKAIAMIKAKPAFKDYKREVESHVGQNHKYQGNFYDPDGTRVELMEDHTADGMPSPMSTAILFEGK